MRVDPLLVVGAALVLGGYAVTAPLAFGVGVISAALVVRRHVSRRAFWVSVALLVVSAARAGYAVPAFESKLLRTRAALGAPRRCSGEGVVATEPARRDEALTYVADFGSLDCEGRTLTDVRVRLREGPPRLARGDRVEVVAQLASAELFRNAELPDPTPSAARAGVTLSGSALSVRVVREACGPAAWIDHARATVRQRIDATFVPAANPMARALVLGENDLSRGDSAAFRASGLAHLLAVSGTHLVFAVLGVVRLFGFLFSRVERLAARYDTGRLGALLGAVLSLVYADFAGGSGSARRAAFMLAIALGVRAIGRRPRAVRSFALSLVTGALVDPLVGFDISFMLSAAATGGLLGLGQPLVRRFVPKGASAFRRFILSPSIATVSAMLPCTPFLVTLGPTLTVAGIAANVMAAPFGEIVSLPLCLLHAILPTGALARGVALVASGALLVVRWLARTSASATWLAASVPPPSAWHFVVLGVGVLGLILEESTPRCRRAAWVVATLAAVAIVECAAFHAGHPRDVLRMTALDVGQGDATLIDLPDGKLMLVDGGGFVGSPVDPGASVILPILRARRRTRIDVAVLTHPHPDHFTGLATVLRSSEVGELWDTGQGRAQGAGPVYAAMISDLQARRIPILGPGVVCGPERALGGARVRVFAPCPSFDPMLGPNDNSFVIKLTFGARRVLLTGDAEHETESTLLAEYPRDLGADILKAGHHGSRTSTSAAFLSAIRPELATISCGVRNRFGHPSPSTLTTLARAGVATLRTDVAGSIEISTDGRRERVRVFGAGEGDRGERVRAWPRILSRVVSWAWSRACLPGSCSPRR